MKVIIFLAAFVGVAAASYASTNYAPRAAYSETGTSNQYRSQDSYGNFDFGYDEQHTSGGSSRREKSDGYGGVTGSYSINDADGRRRTVNYVADAAGFRAQVQTNEPGVEPKDPAAVYITKNGQTYTAEPVAVATPTYAAPAPVYAAPVAPAAPVAYRPAPVYAAPAAPVAYRPAPVYSAPAPIYSAPAPVAYRAAPVAAPVAYQPAPTYSAPAPTYSAPAPVAYRVGPIGHASSYSSRY